MRTGQVNFCHWKVLAAIYWKVWSDEFKGTNQGMLLRRGGQRRSMKVRVFNIGTN